MTIREAWQCLDMHRSEEVVRIDVFITPDHQHIRLIPDSPEGDVYGTKMVEPVFPTGICWRVPTSPDELPLPQIGFEERVYDRYKLMLPKGIVERMREGDDAFSLAIVGAIGPKPV